MTTQTTEITYPPIDSQATYTFIDANVDAAAQTGDLTTDFKQALYNVVQPCLTPDRGMSGYSIDDLWHRYITCVLAGSAIEEAGSPAGAGRGGNGRGLAGNHPGHYISEEKRRNPGNTIELPGGSLPDAQTGWDPDNSASTQMTFSGTRNETGTAGGANGGQILVAHHEASVYTGKWYVEFLQVTGASNRVGLTIAGFTSGRTGNDSTKGAYNDNIQDSLALGDLATGAPLTYSGVSILGGNGDWIGWTTKVDTKDFTDGDVVGFAVDVDTGKVWVSINGTFTGDPAAGTGEDITIPTTVCTKMPLIPAASVLGATSAVTLKMRAADQTYTAPTGFSAWGSTSPATLNPLITGWDYMTSTTSLSGGGRDVRGVLWNGDGTQVSFFDDSTNYSFLYANLSTAYDITSAGSFTDGVNLNGNVRGYYSVRWNGDGTRSYVVDAPFVTLRCYTHSTAYDHSSTTATPTYSTTMEGNGIGFGFLFNNDGTKVFWHNDVNAGYDINETNLTTPYDVNGELTTAGVDHSIDWEPLTPNNLKIGDWDADGTILYFNMVGGHKVFAIQLETAYTFADGWKILPGCPRGQAGWFNLSIQGDTMIGANTIDIHSYSRV